MKKPEAKTQQQKTEIEQLSQAELVELETMLGTEYAGVLSSDDFSVYNGCQVQAQRGSVLGEASPRHLP